MGTFDVAASNIPFGDVAVFDPEFTGAGDYSRRAAAKTIHNYFFLKSLDAVRDGGIVAFITSQGVMNAREGAIRMEMLKHADLVSAVRLPNNLFADHAGTEVGSDLVILQKNERKQAVSETDRLFASTAPDAAGFITNTYFQKYPERIVRTREKTGTNPYGKPAMVYLHEEGVTGIAADMRKALSEDFANRLNAGLYHGTAARQVEPDETPVSVRQEPTLRNEAVQEDFQGRELKSEPEEKEREKEKESKEREEEKKERGIEKEEKEGEEREVGKPEGEKVRVVKEEKPEITPPVMDLYDLFNFTQEERRQAQSGVKKKTATQKDRRAVSARPQSLFEQPQTVERNEGIPINKVQKERPVQSDSLNEAQQGKSAQSNSLNKTQQEKTVLPNPSKTDAEQMYADMDWETNPPINGFYETMMGLTPQQRSELRQPRTERPQVERPQVERLGRSERIASNRLAEDRKKQQEEVMKPRPFAAKLEPHHKEGSLVADGNQIGYLKGVTRYGATFHPLELDKAQQEKMGLYITMRDSYQRLYTYEAEMHEENKPERAVLNTAYDTFIGRYGSLNAKANVKFLLMDVSGRDLLSLERVENGQFIKADIFDHPVAFALNDLAHVDTPHEALSASLNRYGAVDLDYMESLCDNSREELTDVLKGRIFFNPLVDNYEIKDRFIAGNVVEKAERIAAWMVNNQENGRMPEVEASLEALREATPRPITFDELDFNFGERWIPTGMYTAYIRHLFDTDVSIAYSESIDEYSVRCTEKNAKITEQYAVQGQYRKYDGINLLKNALVNTVPDITKSAGRDEHGNEIKVRDSEAIQLANAKIDEIRNGFTDWLGEQSPEFQQRLADMYNRKFNCFVRPVYDGSHQHFPGLDLKALENKYGIKEVYQSQKDCVWMLKQNGGGICDHEVLRP